MQTSSINKSLYFRFYDVGLHLQSDDPGYFDLFAQTYANFQVGQDGAPAPHTLKAIVVTGYDPAGELPALWLDGERWPIHDPIGLRDHIFEYIFAAIAAQVKSHILLHAAVVERNGSALLIAGDSQHGKSSLALGLLRRGFRLLSDELAAISRLDGTVHPFPRKVRATPGSLALAGYTVAPDTFPFWLGKYLIDVEQLQLSTTTTPMPLGDIILLSDPVSQVTTQNTTEPQDMVQITVERLDDSWLKAVNLINGIIALQVHHANHYPTLLLQTQNKVAVIKAIQTLCDTHRILCLEVQKRSPHRPDFTQAPHLTPLPQSLAVMELLRHFQGAHGSVILQQEHKGSATSFFMEVADLVHNTRCYRLSVGHYAQALDLICNIPR